MIFDAGVPGAVLPATLNVIDPAHRGFISGGQGSDDIQDVNRFLAGCVEPTKIAIIYCLTTLRPSTLSTLCSFTWSS